MNYSLKLAISLIIPLQIIACDNIKNKVDTKPIIFEQKENSVFKEKRIYSIEPSKATILWTAFKFTEKVGVSGTFNEFVLHADPKAVSIDDLLKESGIEIITTSVNSNNKLRDSKLREYFFKIFHTDTIKGKIVSADKGKGIMTLEMNNITNDANYTYTIKNDTLSLVSTISLLLWEAEGALEILNRRCIELHTGKDGISMLWPDVIFSIKLPLKPN